MCVCVCVPLLKVSHHTGTERTNDGWMDGWDAMDGWMDDRDATRRIEGVVVVVEPRGTDRYEYSFVYLFLPVPYLFT